VSGPASFDQLAPSLLPFEGERSRIVLLGAAIVNTAASSYGRLLRQAHLASSPGCPSLAIILTLTLTAWRSRRRCRPSGGTSR
jgi:hypothetical protein